MKTLITISALVLMGLVAGVYFITRPQPTYAEWLQKTQGQHLQYAPNVVQNPVSVQVAPNTVQNTINGNQLQGGR